MEVEQNVRENLLQRTLTDLEPISGKEGGIHLHPPSDAATDSGECASAAGEPIQPNMRCVLRDRRQRGQILGRANAIRSFCYECLGWDTDGAGSMAAAVRACDTRECHLWPYRNGALDRRGLADELMKPTATTEEKSIC